MYDYKKIERKWQEYWDSNKTFKAYENSDKEKYYVLIEFPYPSGSGLHIGHPRSYTALDSLARKRRMEGYNVLFPMGWDAFGLPAENYAIQNHIHPREAVKENVAIFKKQCQNLGISFDWDREISTTDPSYFKWTQWQFIKFFEHNLAYKTKKAINWCTACKVGLSNEEVEHGNCERCGGEIVRREKEQWMLSMKSYAEKLIEGLKDTDFIDRVKTAQINWIGKSEGAEITFDIADSNHKLKVYTTRPDTIYGVTFMVLSPEHPILNMVKDKITNYEEVVKYQEDASRKSEFERVELIKEKTGVKLEGIDAVNPLTNEKIQIWISDYVMMNYGTGAIMAVPAHDDRDYDFANKFGIPIVQVIAPFFSPEEDNQLKPDVKTDRRKTVIIALKHHDKDEYLCLNWKIKDWHTFVVGGKESNETIGETAVRELQEETGYKNIRIDKIFNFESHSSFYAAHKGVNRYQEAVYVLAKLEDEESNEIIAEEKDKHDLVWIKKDELGKFINIATYKYMVDLIVNGEKAYTGEGVMINSGILNDINNKEEAIITIINYLEEKGIGKKTTNYRLQDWVFSRQRFWGEPIPMIYCDECDWVPVPDEDLPVMLPEVATYDPTDNGESPLATMPEWYTVNCPKCGKTARRETDTMPNWAGSSWYWLRYMDPHNDQEFVSQAALNYWGMVNWYNGGMEHATRHLLYARFWHRFLYDIGLVPTPEPFTKRTAHGMVLGEDGSKISKSKGNGINPNDIIDAYSADALRTYELFMGDYEMDTAWSTNGLKGCKRFLDKLWRVKEKVKKSGEYSKKLESIINQTIKKVSNDIEQMKYNTAVSALMILLNEYEKQEYITDYDLRVLITLLNPFAPHITEEINELKELGKPLCDSPWPKYDELKTQEDTYELIIQVNGKVRGKITVRINIDEEEMKKQAVNHENAIKHIEGKEIIKIIVVPKKLVNIVVK